MPNIPPLEPADASQEARAVYDEFYRKMSFPAPPNFIKTQGHSATVARGTFEVVHNVLVTGKIPRWIKEVIFVAISKDRACRYCEAAHIACCRMLGVDTDLLKQLAEDVHSLTNPKIRDMVLFALKTSRDPQALTDEDFVTLGRHDLKDSEIMELIAMSALAVYANIVADATAMDADEMFSTL